MNKKQCLAMKYQETKIKPNKITVSFAFNAIDNFGYFVLFYSICKEYVNPVWRSFFVFFMIYAYSFRND